MSNTVRLTRVFKTDIDTLFDLWTKPEHLKQWHRPHPTLYKTPDAAVDLRVGGELKIVMDGPEGQFTVESTFTEIDRPHSLGLAWKWANSDEVTMVHVSFKEVDGGTELTLIHEHPDSSQMADKHKAGWEGCFEVLDSLINTEG
jgi:uncharacterized protein YndB with AHSA1/START domain